MDIINIISLIMLGYAIGSLYTTFKFMRILRNAAKETGINLDLEVEKLQKSKQVTKLFIDKHNDTLYLYDFETNDFVCQGKSMDELVILAKKYKNIENAFVKHDNKMFVFKNGTHEEMIKNES
jgi:hypothetical protein